MTSPRVPLSIRNATKNRRSANLFSRFRTRLTQQRIRIMSRRHDNTQPQLSMIRRQVYNSPFIRSHRITSSSFPITNRSNVLNLRHRTHRMIISRTRASNIMITISQRNHSRLNKHSRPPRPRTHRKRHLQRAPNTSTNLMSINSQYNNSKALLIRPTMRLINRSMNPNLTYSLNSLARRHLVRRQAHQVIQVTRHSRFYINSRRHPRFVRIKRRTILLTRARRTSVNTSQNKSQMILLVNKRGHRGPITQLSRYLVSRHVNASHAIHSRRVN